MTERLGGNIQIASSTGNGLKIEIVSPQATPAPTNATASRQTMCAAISLVRDVTKIAANRRRISMNVAIVSIDTISLRFQIRGSPHRTFDPSSGTANGYFDFWPQVRLILGYIKYGRSLLSS